MLMAFSLSANAQGFSFGQPGVPKAEKFNFSNDEATQVEQLQNNSMLQYFQENRKAMSALDKFDHRPVYHFTSPEQRLNDPNGLCFWNGRWHMFYQAYPTVDYPRVYWGHAVSDDMYNWKDLPLAIYPNEESSCFSGGTTVADGQVVAAYNGPGVGNVFATSSDPFLLNWEKQGHISASIANDGLSYSLGDPTVWKNGDFYYAFSGGTYPTGPAGTRLCNGYLFRSKDLKTWEYLHPFIQDDWFSGVGDTGGCPYFLPIGKDGKWMFLNFSHRRGAKYLIGNYDTKQQIFHVINGGPINEGPARPGGTHAPSTFAIPDGSGDVVAVYNVKPLELSEGANVECFTMPQVLSIDAQNNLYIKPFDGYQTFRKEKKSLANIAVPANKEVQLKGIKGNVMEIDMEFDGSTPNFEIKVLADAKQREYTSITFIRDAGMVQQRGGSSWRVILDHTHGSLSDQFVPRTPEVADFAYGNGEPMKVKIFIDKSIVEVFVNDQAWVMLRTYPILKESNNVFVKAFGNGTTVKSVEAWQMGGIDYSFK